MRTGAARVRDWAGLGAFYCGLIAIGAAGGLYVVYDRLPVAAAVPPKVAQLCAGSGKGGVALAGVFVGLSLMVVGAALLPPPRRAPVSTPRTRATCLQFFISPDRPEIEPSVTAYGRVILRTERYVAAKSPAPERAAHRNPLQ